MGPECCNTLGEVYLLPLTQYHIIYFFFEAGISHARKLLYYMRAGHVEELWKMLSPTYFNILVF